MDIGSLFSSSWDKVSKNMGLAIGIYLVAGLALSIVSVFTLGVLTPPVSAGLHKVFRKIQRDETPDFNDLFSEFSNFSQWIMLWVIALILSVAGFIMFWIFFVVALIPILGLLVDILVGLALGIILNLVFSFHIPLMLERRLSAFDAIGASFSMVLSKFWTVLPPLLMMSLVLAVSCLVPPVLLISGPWSLVVVWSVYDHVFEQPVPPYPDSQFSEQ